MLVASENWFVSKGKQGSKLFPKLPFCSGNYTPYTESRNIFFLQLCSTGHADYQNTEEC